MGTRVSSLTENIAATPIPLASVWSHTQAQQLDVCCPNQQWPAVEQIADVPLKLVLDMVASATLLLVFLPLMLAVAVLIKLSSPGPVLFSQIRLGRNKRQFTIYKFRTMTSDAEQRFEEIEHLNEVSGPVFKMMNDPRVTRVGRFLRKTSLDELPQLVNVLKGDMSLVGPRPLSVRDYNKLQAGSQTLRLSVRPGITCLWQVNGRSLIPFDRWMELDLQYIHQQNFWLDLKILMRTLPAVLKGTGAA